MENETPPELAPVFYLSHGGGPLPLLGDQNHKEMVDLLLSITPSLGQPKAIVVISAHWEESVVSITSGESPDLIYDYYGFPPESYEIQYPAPGKPELAHRLHSLFQRAGIQSTLNDHRGFDHGLFVPLKIMYPKANIPCIQISLSSSLKAEEHIEIGKALKELRKENILFIGSGFSFHNMRAFFSPMTPETITMNHEFVDWLTDTCSNEQFTECEREQRLIYWEKAPSARYCHPREEHLLPLHVCYGIAGSVVKKAFTLEILNKKTSAYLW